jgi:ABC-type oligopeptide transport system substrate-binding subunit/class 3 adenylate cyclase
MTFNLFAALAAYIPRDRVEAILNPRHPLAEDGVAMIADISGFTPLTEALTQGLSEGQGAEELTRTLTAVFTPLIAEIHAFRGTVIKFSGDALIIWFGRPKRGHRSAVIRRALTCAWHMQQRIQIDGQIPTPIGIVTLKMKIGLAYGPVKRFNLGLAEYGYEDVLAGATLDLMAEAEHQAEPGEIVLPRATAVRLPYTFTVSQWRGRFAVVGSLFRPARRLPWPLMRPLPNRQEALSKELAPYLPRPIYEALLSGQAQVAELKPVVSLFIQFHGLDYDADPAIREKLQSYFVTAQRVVARYNGRLNRLITGDKGSLLHIIFGAPRTVEEQEERAVRCALDLQAECGGLPFITMQRVGVSLGRVFVGPVGSPVRHDYTTMGDSINLSARLMQQAADDQVLLETAVRQQLGPEFKLTDLGTIQVKGKAEPIHIFSVEGVRAQRVRRQVKQIQPVFGREAEMAALRHRIANLAHGQGSMMTLVGDVGMGKTLIFDVLRAETEGQWVENPETAGIWAGGISLAYGQLFSGYLFIDLLRDLLNLPADATPDQTSQYLLRHCQDVFGEARLESTYPYLAKFMGLPLTGDYAQRIEGLAGESLRWQVFELVPEMLRVLSGRHPIILTLDDLQWADPTSLQLVETLLPLLADVPIFIILAMRPEADSQAWAKAQHQLAEFILAEGRGERREERGERRKERGTRGDSKLTVSSLTVTLAELDEWAAAQVISHHAPNLPQRLMTYLVEKGGGNPLFLVEMVRTLAAKGLLSGEVDLQTIALDALDLPNSVQGLLLAQLDRLAVEARHTLQMAAVIGKTFLHKVLETIAGAEQQVQNQLAELERRDYIQPDRDDLGAAHTFRHILIQESAYNTLLHERRRDYHRQTAEALERLFPAAIAEQAAFLAYHYEQAEELNKAIYYLNQTADQARLLYAHEEADLLYGRILTLLEKLPADRVRLDHQAKTYLKIAQVKMNTLDFGQAQTYYELAFERLERLEEEQEQADSREGDKEIPPFRWGIPEQFIHDLDPAHVETDEALQLIINLFEGLVELDDEWNVIPLLARRWQVLDGGRRYRFELRQDWRWSDGLPVTAHDFVFAWRRNLTPQTNTGMAHQLYVIQGAAAFHQGKVAEAAAIGIHALDDWTLEIVLDTPINYFLYLLAYPVMLPQPAHHVRQQPDKWATPDNLVCNGPFRPQYDPEHSDLYLNRNPYYRGLRGGNLDQVALHFQKPNWQHYQQDEVDWCRVDDRSDLAVRYPESAFLVQGFVTFFLGFACQMSPFDNKFLRQAFACAVDRQELVRLIWANVQKPATGGFVPPGMPGHSPEIGLPFDPERARSLLHEAGYRDGSDLPSLTLLALPGFAKVPAYLQQQWRRVLNVRLEIEDNLTDEEFMAHMRQGQGQLALLGWYAAFPDPDDVLRGIFYGSSPHNVFNWHNSLFNELLDQAQGMTSSRQRFELYHEADKVLVQTETAIVPLYYLQAHGLLRPPFHFADSGKIIRDTNIKFKNIRYR